MRSCLLALCLLVFVCPIAAIAQVVESESRVSIVGDLASVRLAVRNDGSRATVPASIELVDTDGKIRAKSTAKNYRMHGGFQILEFALPLVSDVQEDIAWYRMRYRIGQSSGTVSLSQLMPDLFELRVIAGDGLFAGMNYRVRIRAVNPFTDKPAGGVKVDTVLELSLKGDGDQKLKLNGSGETDAAGFAVIDFTIPPEARLDEDGEITVIGKKNGIIREANEDISSMTGAVQFVIMTDKPIYQPEQSLKIRGLLIKGGESKTVVSNTEVEFRISDEDGTVLYREKVKTSWFGIAAMEWRVPSNAKLGDYRIEVRDEDGEEITGQRVKVSRYDLPNFAVQAKALKPYYLPGENEAEIEVRADYLFGKPVTGGKIRVVEETSREWDWKAQKYEIDEGQIREGVTDSENKFTAKIDLKEAHESLRNNSWRKFRDISLAAYVTDPTTNKTEQRRFDIRVSKEAIHVYFIGESYNLNPNLPINAYVSTFYADGTPAECEVEMKASPEEVKRFQKVERLRTNSYGGGKLSILRPSIGDPDDDLDLEFIAKDKVGRTGSFTDDISFEPDDEALQITADRTIYKPGEMMTLTLKSTIKNSPVYIDVVSGLSVIDSRFSELRDGRAVVLVPYDKNFKGQLTIAAYIEKDENDIIKASRGVIFPARQAIDVTASFEKAVYKPNDEATAKFTVVDALGEAIASALGIVVIDKAVEERARTDAEFGGMWGSIGGWLGYGANFGSVNVKDLNELDLTKPIPAELQLVAEIILHDQHYQPNIFRSESYYSEAKSVFSKTITKQFEPVAAALKDTFEKRNYLHPTDDAGLGEILRAKKIEFDRMLDPWGIGYKAKFSVDKAQNIASIESAGPDKIFETKDDFTAFTTGFAYFTPIGKAVDHASHAYFARTQRFIRDEKTLLGELGVNELLDRFGRPYRITFESEGRFFMMRFKSGGKDGKFERYDWAGDDFYVWTNRIDYFATAEARIAESQQTIKKVPMSEAEFRGSLKDAGIDIDGLRDGQGNALYITVTQKSRYWDRVTIENTRKFGETNTTERRVITPVTQQVVEFVIRSKGRDGVERNYDDFNLTQIVHVLSEQSRGDAVTDPVVRRAGNVISTGSIAGTVMDPSGALVPGATVASINETTNVTRSVTTNDSGRYFIGSLEAGTYSIRVEAAGFTVGVIQSIPVTANKTAEANVTLEVGSVAQVVNVTGGNALTLNSTSSLVATTITGQLVTGLPLNARNALELLKIEPAAATAAQDKSTPRLREYFPETLLWQPEVLTDKDGKAEVKFRMADNITTWKMYTIASTRTGKIGVAQNEVTAFQPFFVDLDPPEFLTLGDEIYLPSQVRNYTEKKQQVDVSMAKADWFSQLGAAEQRMGVEAGATRNTIFGFKAVETVKEGKQRVSAIAETDSDAIEKPVTVRPDGREIVRTDSRVSRGPANFNLNFPANALPRTQKAELKIYPNLFSHVAESVEGLLARPYGCGEQTISSTYPNLMILKFAEAETPMRRKAKTYLQKGYERLLGYQAANGGFTYWGGSDTPDIPLTAYAIRFLADAKPYLVVDESVVKKAEDWLGKQQRTDGSWSHQYRGERTEDAKRTRLFTAYVARILAMTRGKDNAAAVKALNYLRTRNAEVDEPYEMALTGLANLDIGNKEEGRKIAERLAAMAIKEGGAAYWKLESNTPFYGWGTAGRIETTAMVLQLLIRDADSKGEARSRLIDEGTLFLLRNKDRYGVWHSTQTTINVLDAFLAALAGKKTTGDQSILVTVNGETVQELTVPADKIDPFTIDLNSRINAAANSIEVRSSGDASVMSQIVSYHYIDWRDSDASNRTVNQSRALKLDYSCDKTAAAIMEEVSCSVKAERIGSSGYGMLLAEIGTPPGADVSRESLQKAIEADWSISRYEVLPDRIIIYMWSKAGGTNFNFNFKPRYGIKAQTPASIVYDYYNPEAHAVVAPVRFTVK